ENVFDGGVLEQVFERAQTRQLFGERLGQLPDLRLVESKPAQAHEAVDFDIDELLDGATRPASELRTELLDTAEQVIVGCRFHFMKAWGSHESRSIVGQFDGSAHYHDEAFLLRICINGQVVPRERRPASQRSSHR